MALAISPAKKQKLRVRFWGSSFDVGTSRPEVGKPKKRPSGIGASASIIGPKPPPAQFEQPTGSQRAANRAAETADRAAAARLGVSLDRYQRALPKPDYYAGKVQTSGIGSLAGIVNPLNRALSPVTDIAQLLLYTPVGAVRSVGAGYADLKDAELHGNPSFKRSRAIGKAMGQGFAQDFTHFSYSRSLRPVADVAGVAAAGAGTVARGAAALSRGARAVEAANAAGDVSKLGKLRAAAHYLDVRKPTPGKDFPDRSFYYGGEKIPGVYSRSALTRAGQRAWDRMLGLEGSNPMVGRGGGVYERLRAGKIGKELNENARVAERVALAPSAALAKLGDRLTGPQQEAIRIAAEGVPAAERIAYHAAGEGGFHQRRVNLAKAADVHLNQPVEGAVLPPTINPDAVLTRSLLDRLMRRGVSGPELAQIYDKTAASAGRREATLRDAGLSNDASFAGRVQGPGRMYRGAEYLSPQAAAELGLPPEAAGLVGAEGFNQGVFRVPATPGYVRGRIARYGRAIRRPGRPPSLNQPFTGRMVEKGTHGGPSTKLVARSEAESVALAQMIDRVKQLGRMGVKTPPLGQEAHYRPVVLNPRIVRDPVAQRALVNVEQGTGLTAVEKRALGHHAEQLRQAALPNPGTVEAGQEGVRWIPNKLARGLDKPAEAQTWFGQKATRVLNEVNRGSTAGVLYAAGTGYVVPQWIGNEFVRFADQGLLGPIRGWQAAKLWKDLDAEGRSVLGALGGTHAGIVGSVTPEAVGPVSATINKLASLFGTVIDSPLRIPSVVHHMINQGYEPTVEGFAKLLANPDDTIRVGRRAVTNSIDFSRLGPTEAKLARLLVWFYPWLKASTMYLGHLAREHPALSAAVMQSGAYGKEHTGLVAQPAATEGTFKTGDTGDPNRPMTSNPNSAAILNSGPQAYNTIRGALLGGLKRGQAPLDWTTPAIAAFSYFGLRVDPFTGAQAKPNEGVVQAIEKTLPLPRPVSLLKSWQSGGGKQFPMSHRDVIRRAIFGSVAPRPEDQQVTRGYTRKETRALMNPVERAHETSVFAKSETVKQLRSIKQIDGFHLPPELKQAIEWQAQRTEFRLGFASRHGISKPSALDNIAADLSALEGKGLIPTSQADEAYAIAKQLASTEQGKSRLNSMSEQITDAYYGGQVLKGYRHLLRTHNLKPTF